MKFINRLVVILSLSLILNCSGNEEEKIVLGFLTYNTHVYHSLQKIYCQKYSCLTAYFSFK